ncbi:hypothetical protein JOF29_008155 [Kribbella aluminosa]|uniref:Immunity protein 50 of polymorphic toxin system n=1 Tax=Kribbella aluminosa TaxID=416017 RepID=A0ABS4UZI4_9ACTN|nr:hypothetical protein [Kribbella aluminosa]MBP2357045.1 hypothetical protein [Kribbella aluminosa]
MSVDPRHDLASGGTGLFEFWTDQGVPVYLHDMDLSSAEVRPVDRVLVLQFEYTERPWTPAAAAPTPVVVMRFEGVTIRGWNQEAAAPVHALGQVEDFEYDGEEAFKLTTCSAIMEFTAARLTITPRSMRE